MLRFGIKWLKRMTPLHLNTNEFLIAAKKCWCLLIAPIWLLSHADRRHSDQDGWEWFNFRKRRGRPVHYYRFKLAVNWSILERFRCFLSETNVQNECYKWSEPHLNTFSSSKAINIKFSFCHSFNKTKTKKKNKKTERTTERKCIHLRCNYGCCIINSTHKNACILCAWFAINDVPNTRCLHRPMSWCQCFLLTLIIRIEPCGQFEANQPNPCQYTRRDRK